MFFIFVFLFYDWINYNVWIVCIKLSYNFDFKGGGYGGRGYVDIESFIWYLSVCGIDKNRSFNFGFCF